MAEREWRPAGTNSGSATFGAVKAMPGDGLAPTRRVVVAGLVIAAASTASAWPARAQTAPGRSGAVVEGSRDTVIGGGAAARVGDRAADGTVIEGSSNVIINGKPAALGGSGTSCGGIVVGGASSVVINGKPAARAGDATAGCPAR